MPKHLIEFNLPDEATELETALKAGAYHSVLWDISQLLRNAVKHETFNGKKLNAGQLKAAQHLKEEFWRIMYEHDAGEL